MNLLTYINHLNTGLKQKMLDLQTQQLYRSLLEIQMCIKHCGYDIMVLPQITCFTSLQSFVTKLSVPMLVSLEVKCRTYMLRHVIGISPIISRETGQVEYHIINGAHPEMKAMKFSQENIDWCCGKNVSFQNIASGFAFMPGKRRVFEMLTDKAGYNVEPGTSMCLIKNPKTSNRGGWKNKTDRCYKMIFGQNNVIKREKSECVEIWKQLTKEYQKEIPAYRRRKRPQHNMKTIT